VLDTLKLWLLVGVGIYKSGYHGQLILIGIAFVTNLHVDNRRVLASDLKVTIRWAFVNRSAHSFWDEVINLTDDVYQALRYCCAYGLGKEGEDARVIPLIVSPQ